MLTRILLGICLALLLIAIGLGWYAKGVTERAAEASSQAIGYRAALEAQNAEIAAYGARLEAREAERAQAARRAAKWERNWRAALDDKPTAEWAATVLPRAAADRLRELSSSGAEQPAADYAPADADTTTDVHSRD